MAFHRPYNTRSRNSMEPEDPSGDDESLEDLPSILGGDGDDDDDEDEEEENDEGDEEDSDDDDDNIRIRGYWNSLPPPLLYMLRQQAMNGRPEAMILVESLYRNGMMGMDDDDEEDDRPCQCVNCTRMKCPVCSALHDRDCHRHGSFEPRPEHQCSHGAMMLFVPADCPVCMEEQIDPPVVALACGHVLCTDDFKTLGGRIGAPQEEEEEEEEEAHEMSPQEYRSFFQRMGRPPWMRGFDEEDEDDDDEDDDDDDDMPPLLRDDDQENEEEDDEDDDDDDLPALVSRTPKDHRYPLRSRSLAGMEAAVSGQQEEESDSDSDSDEDMPQLLAR
jgi:hypothetical protein